MTAAYHKYSLNFKQPSGTSRGIMTTKETWFVILKDDTKFGIGECGILRGLSVDDRPDYEDKLKWACSNINLGSKKLLDELIEYPSIQFGLEMAFRSLKTLDSFNLFPSKFTKGQDAISINGLIWMGDKTFMKNQIKEKIKAGSFEALEKLKQLSDYQLHSIEQPIKQGQWQEMAALCEATPLPIALDEELIGVFSMQKRRQLLETIKPQYIILKPSLVGGFDNTSNWITLTKKQNIGWWITSALESNVGLNAIAQYTYTKQSKLPQGLGTGSLFTNNFESPLSVKNGTLHYDTNTNWKFNLL